MRYLRRAGLVALCTAGLLAMAVPSAGAAPVAPPPTSCSGQAIVRPLLGAPSCTTPPVTCPADATAGCDITLSITAKTLLGLGASQARMDLLDSDGVSVGNITCTGPSSGCSRTAGPAFAAAGITGSARCAWTGSTLGVLATVSCSMTFTPIAVPA